jgi:putative membrane protein
MDFIGHGYGMGFGMWFIPILLILIVIYFLKENSKSQRDNSSAQDILDKRYANGEIDTEEYQQMSDALKKNK